MTTLKLIPHIKRYFFLLLFLSFLVILFILRYTGYQKYHQTIRGDVEFVLVLKERPVVINNTQYFNAGRMRIRVREFPQFEFGDILEISGNTSDGYYLDYPRINKVGVSDSLYVNMLYPVVILRSKIEGIIESHFLEPYSSLIIGMLIGVDKLPHDIKNSLISSGTIHVVVVSGFNVSLIIGFIYYLIKSKNKALSIIISGLITIFYVFLAGASPPVVRAAIMGTLGFIGRSFGRKTDGILLLFVAGYSMLFVNPIILWDIGFQLSFLATFGLILLEGDMRKFIKKINVVNPFMVFNKFKYRGIRIEDKPLIRDILIIYRFILSVFIEGMSSTLAASIMVYPLIVYYFGRLSILSPITNSITMWLIPIVTVLAIILVILGLFNILFIKYLYWIVYIPMTYFVFVVQKFGSLGVSSIKLKMDIYSLVGAYSILAFIIMGLYGYRKFNTNSSHIRKL